MLQDTRPETLRAAYAVDEDLYRRAFALHIRRAGFDPKNLLFLAAAAVFLIWNAVERGDASGLLAAVVAISLALIFGWRFQSSLYPSLLIAQLRRSNPEIFAETVVEATPHNLTVSMPTRRAEWSMAALNRIEATEDMMLVYIDREAFQPIPRAADFGPDTFESFCIKFRVMFDAAKAGKPAA